MYCLHIKMSVKFMRDIHSIALNLCNTNGNREEFYRCQVTVLVPPTFTEIPEDQEKVSGSDLLLVCSATGYPTPTITWEFDGKPIHGVGIVTNTSGTSVYVPWFCDLKI